MKKRIAWIAVAVVVLGAIFGVLGVRIASAYADLQMRLDGTNRNLRTLNEHVQELDRQHERDAQRIADIEGYLSSEPWK